MKKMLKNIYIPKPKQPIKLHKLKTNKKNNNNTFLYFRALINKNKILLFKCKKIILIIYINKNVKN